MNVEMLFGKLYKAMDGRVEAADDPSQYEVVVVLNAGQENETIVRPDAFEWDYAKGQLRLLDRLPD